MVAGCLLLSSRVFSVAKALPACCQPEELPVSTDDLQASVYEEQSFCGQEAFKYSLIGMVVCSFINLMFAPRNHNILGNRTIERTKTWSLPSSSLWYSYGDRNI